MTGAEEHRDWRAAFDEELRELHKRSGAEPGGDERIGLAFSGGGIRSATFGLGVLEGLKQRGLLRSIQYLSTVSGGGYIGAWLSASCRRHPTWLDPSADWSQSVAHLRRYSNYLSPKVGFFSADTWSMFTVWIRNTLLVQITVVLAIASVLMLPRPLLELFRYWPMVGDLRWLSIALFLLGVAGIAGNQIAVNSRTSVAFLQAKSWPLGLLGAAVCVAVAWAVRRVSRVRSVPRRPGELPGRGADCRIAGAGGLLAAADSGCLDRQRSGAGTIRRRRSTTRRAGHRRWSCCR